MILDILTAIGTIGAVVIGMVAIYHSNKNSRREIRVNKVEEIFELMQSLNRYYGIFEGLFLNIKDLRDKDNRDIQTLTDYYKLRDEKIPAIDRLKVISDLSRFEVLIKCYIKGDLLNRLLKYEDLMYSFSELVFNGGSIHQELKWKEGFPTHENFFKLTEQLKKELIDQIGEK